MALLTIAVMLALHVPNTAVQRDTRSWYQAYDEGRLAVGKNDAAAIASLEAAKRNGPKPGRNINTYGETYVTFNPDYYLGIAYLNLKRYAEAEAAFSRAQEANVFQAKDPESSALRRHVAKVSTELALAAGEQALAAGQFDQAAKSMQQASSTANSADNPRVKDLANRIDKARNTRPATPTPTPATPTPTPATPTPSPPASLINVPNLLGATEQDARARLDRSSLRVGNVTMQEFKAAPGTVLNQQPAEGTRVVAGTAVNLVVSAATTIQVPSVVGLPQKQAVAALTAASLRVGRISTTQSRSTTGLVLQQAVAAGTRVAEGTAVDLSVAAPIVPATTPGPTVTPMPSSDPNVSAAEQMGMTLFFTGDYAGAIAPLRAVRDGSTPTARAYFYLACAQAAMYASGRANQQELDDAKQLFSTAKGDSSTFSADRRYISPRILELLGAQR